MQQDLARFKIFPFLLEMTKLLKVFIMKKYERENGS
jgi:hypothetical protein